ncbi:DUF3429 domain-containing protein [Celeribacter marinus]|uniref:DUF3429 domain-containing protein n=1 Tax=Celeribacter marinus TaxID=1397108 RepID=UPI000783D958|nr:DUF3429 domain-containing protein [Celeribacter marinus]SFK20274.1 Protein of unknown function [Celeribacter marinus]
MSTYVPRQAALLTGLGVLPFAWGALLSFSGSNDAAREVGSYLVFSTSNGLELLLIYGLIILNYMAGCLWAFAAKSERAQPHHYVLAVIPALYALFTVGPFLFDRPSHGGALMAMILGFIGLLAFDFWFKREGLAPVWWMRLRLPVTAAVVTCLGLGWTNA